MISAAVQVHGVSEVAIRRGQLRAQLSLVFRTSWGRLAGASACAAKRSFALRPQNTRHIRNCRRKEKGLLVGRALYQAMPHGSTQHWLRSAQAQVSTQIRGVVPWIAAEAQRLILPSHRCWWSGRCLLRRCRSRFRLSWISWNRCDAPCSWNLWAPRLQPARRTPCAT